MARRKALTQSLVHAMQIRRLCFFAGCMITGFAALGYRLVDLQLMRHDELREAARNNTERTFVRRPKRGDIRDARGNLLATSKTVHTVCANPEILGTNYLSVATQLAPVLDMPLEELADKLRPRERTNELGKSVPIRWAVVKKKLERDEWEKTREAMRQVSFGVDESKLNKTQRSYYNRIRDAGIFDEPEEMRFYPNGALAAHVLGFVGVTDKTNAAGRAESCIEGKDGLELTLNRALTGIDGWRQTETDSRKRELVLFREQDVAPREGLSAVLTIDAGVQHIVEDEITAAMEKHTPESVCSIVLRPKTGEILALAVLPNFDPNDPGDAPTSARRNRTISDIAEPGSTFKVVIISGAFNDGVVGLNDMINCEDGVFRYGGLPLRDDHPLGMAPVWRVICKSSNIGAAKIGLQLGKQRIYDYIKAFGFGQRTGIPLPWEVSGIVHSPPHWSGVSITRIPMGHEVACTPLQMVMAIATVANKGVLMRPMLVDSLVDERGEQVAKFLPQPVRRVISEQAAEKMVEALKYVVSTNGTGIRAKLAYYTAAGKTGTAQKLVDGRYVRNQHYTSFIGFFPADDPELCISVVLDDPKNGYYGSEAAAPVFQRIAERAANYLAIPPEHIPSQALTAAVSRGTN